MEEKSKHFVVLGPAGCGKSFVRQEYLALNPRALLLGTTGASIAGTRNSYTVERFLHMKRKNFILPSSIIIEECSMLDSATFSRLNRKLKQYGSTQPFGGVQVIMFGDVLQLPPVTGRYFFTCKLFEDSGFEVLVLRENFRQQDLQLKKFCETLRYGGHADTRALLEYRRRPPMFTPTICATKKVAAEHNRRALAKWNGNELKVGSHDWKVNVPVVVTQNIYSEGRLVVANGTFGRLNKEGKFVEPGKRALTVDSRCLALNFAMTVHRAQGKTLQTVAIDGKGGMFSPHQLYVAVSRAQFSDKLYINNVTPEDAAVPWLDDLNRFAKNHLL